MTDTPLPTPGAKPKRRWLRRSVGCLGVLLLVLLAAPWWLPSLAESVGPYFARKFAGYEVEIGAIERLDLGGLRARDLRVRELGDEVELRNFRAQRLDVTFHWRLLSGDLEGLETIEARGVQVEWDASASAPESDEAPETASASIELPAKLPAVDLTDVEVSVYQGEDPPLEFDEAALHVDDRGGVRLQAQSTGHVLALLGNWNAAQLVDLQVLVDGETLIDDSRADLSRLGQGELQADLNLIVGEARGALALGLDSEGATWDLQLGELDLEALQERLPLGSEGEWFGHLDLRSTGELGFEDPLGSTAEVHLETAGVRLGEWRLVEGEVDLSMAEGVLNVGSLLLRQSAENLLTSEKASLPLRGTNAANWLERSQGRLRIDCRDLGQILRPLGLLPEDAPELVEHHLTFDTEIAQARARVREGHLESSAGRLVLESAEVWIQEGTASTIGLTIDGVAEISSLTEFGRLLGRADWAGTCNGRLNVAGTWPDLDGQLDLRGEALTLEGYGLGLLELKLKSSEEPQRVEVERLHAVSDLGSLDAAFDFDWKDADYTLDLRQLDLLRESRQLRLSQPTRIELTSEGGKLAPLILTGDAGELEAHGEWSAERIDFQLDTRALEPEVFLAGVQVADLFEHGDHPAPQATCTAKISLVGEVLTIETAGELQDLRWKSEEPIGLSWDFSHDGQFLRVRKLTARGAGGLSVDSSGILPLVFAPEFQFGEDAVDWQLDVRLPLLLLPGGYDGAVSVVGNLNGLWSDLGGQLQVLGEDLRLPEGFHPSELDFGRVAGSVTLNDGLRCDGLEIEFGDLLNLGLRGEVDLPLDVPRWIDDTEGALEESRVDAKLELGALDLERLSPLLQNYSESAEALRSGQLSGHLALDGPLGEPQLAGELLVAKTRLRLGGGLPTIEGLAGRVRLEKDDLIVESLTGTLGAAPFKLTGNALLSGDQPDLDLTVTGDGLLLFRDPRTQIRANTNLHVAGPVERLVISGNVELTKGHYAPDTAFFDLRGGKATSGARGFQIFSLRDAPLRDITFDIELSSRVPFELRNNIIRGGMRPKLHLGGTGLVPVLSGSVFLDHTMLELPATRLELTGGTVQFNEENPFVPTVEVVGTTRMMGYDIIARISGDYDDMEIVLTSTPPLPQEDLFLLVLTGRLPEDPDRSNAMSTANTVAIYLARDTISRWFADDGPINEDSVLERLEFSFGEDISKNGVETVDAVFRLSSKSDLPPEERDARHWYLAAERDKYEDYNYGLRIVFRLGK